MPNKPKTMTLHVSSEKGDCMKAKTSEKDEWGVFCETIQGFEYEEGYNYTLSVLKTKKPKEERTEGASEYVYTLAQQIAKTPNLKEDGIYAYIQTNYGDIVGKLAMEKAPLTVANFVGLAEGSISNTFRAAGEPYFDSLIFHRVIPNFMIQGGDPTGTGSGGPGYKFKNEIHPDLKHDKPGIFSMANSGPNTNGSQFFITHKATPWLDGGYNIFGSVVLGQKYVTLIGNSPRGRADRPKEPVRMNKVEIIRIGVAAKSFDANATFNRLK
jgi:cyclophilin family peptidyl-prolyl cis-trans isomerase